MRTIGLIGGLSWESSLEYYRLLNEGVKNKLGGLHSAQCLMHSVDFGPIEDFMRKEDWQKIDEKLIDAAFSLQRGGADFLIICSNTMHKFFGSIEQQTGMPMIHIADAAAQSIKEQKIRKVGLLGTKFAMEGDFYRKRLKEKHHIEVIIPESPERDIVNNIIFQELCLGIFKPDSKAKCQKIIHQLLENGAEGIVLGCTEIPLLIKQSDVNAPVFDTMGLHAAAAVEYALEQ